MMLFKSRERLEEERLARSMARDEEKKRTNTREKKT